jgi:hypothetical protein
MQISETSLVPEIVESARPGVYEIHVATIRAHMVGVAFAVCTAYQRAQAAGADLVAIQESGDIPPKGWIKFLNDCGLKEKTSQSWMDYARNREALDAAGIETVDTARQFLIELRKQGFAPQIEYGENDACRSCGDAVVMDYRGADFRAKVYEGLCYECARIVEAEARAKATADEAERESRRLARAEAKAEKERAEKAKVAALKGQATKALKKRLESRAQELIDAGTPVADAQAQARQELAPPDETKICNKCKQPLPLLDFDIMMTYVGIDADKRSLDPEGLKTWGQTIDIRRAAAAGRTSPRHPRSHPTSGNCK